MHVISEQEHVIPHENKHTLVEYGYKIELKFIQRLPNQNVGKQYKSNQSER